MKIIGMTVRVTYAGDDRANEKLVDAVATSGKADQGRLATVVGWTPQPFATTKADRWLVHASLDDGQLVNYRTTELAFLDGTLLPTVPDITEVV